MLVAAGGGLLLAGTSQPPPNRGTINPDRLYQPQVPAGATLVSTRHVDGWTLRIYASPSGLTPASVRVTYEEVDSHGRLQGWGSTTVGASLLAPPGIVPCGHSSEVADCQITKSSIIDVRLMAGDHVLDAMAPASYHGVRFVILAKFTRAVPTAIEGLDAEGRVIATTQPDWSS